MLVRGCGLSSGVVDVDEEERVGVWEGGRGGVVEVSVAGVREGIEKDEVGILREWGEVRGEFVAGRGLTKWMGGWVSEYGSTWGEEGLGGGGQEPGDWEEEAEDRTKGITGICDE